MNKKLSPIQIIIFTVLILAILFGVIIFVIGKKGSNKDITPITMWGTFPKDSMENLQKLINDEEEQPVNIIYREFTEAQFEGALIEALASGDGPDVVIMTDDLLARHDNKIFKIGYDIYPQKQFKDTFIEGGEILLREDGILGFPIMIDPLLLYWNRSILNTVGISQPPKIWSEFLDIIPRIVKSDSQANITRAGISLGEFSNINNAEEILVSLIQQAGNPIIVTNGEGEYLPVIDQRLGYKLRPAEAALTFFTQFSNPTKSVYSWNRSLPNSESMFSTGDLAFYIGFASERDKLIKKNSNLNFDVALLPQSSSGNSSSTYGRIYYLSILNKSENIASSFETIMRLIEPDNILKISDAFKMSPVRRDLLGEQPAVSYKQVFNDSALIAKGVYDIDSGVTNEIFKSMIENVTSGRSGVSDSVDRVAEEFKELYK